MNSESNQEALQNRNKIRSSLRKASEDVPVPPLRRVSFAANSTIKPFVNDGDRTIWDNTYEEEVNSAHSLNNLDGTKMTADMSFTCCNFGNIVDQENIPPTANRTTLELCDMELTSQFNDADSEEPMDIDVTNRTIYPQDDVSLTCRFPEVKRIESTSHNENVVDHSMEFTCQFSTACNNIITKPQQSEAGSSMSEQNIEEKQELISKTNDRSTEVLQQTLNEEVQAVNTESIPEERETETVNSTTDPEVEIKVACTNEDEISYILETQCDLVNLTDLEASNSIAESTVDSTQALIQAASSVANNNSIDQLMESMNRILGNYELITYQPVTVDLTECNTTIKNSQEVLKKAKECLANYQPHTEFRLTCQSLTSTTSETESETNTLTTIGKISIESASETNTLTSTDSSDSEQCLNSDVDEVVDLPKPLMDQIREVFDKSEPTDIKLIEIEEKTILFTAFSESIWFRADLHQENDNVIELTSLQVLNETSEDPNHSLCKFLVEHLMSKTQMDQLTSSLGQSFDMLSLLEYLQMIIDKYYDFFWTFLMLQRKFTSLKIDNNGTFTFDMVCSRSQTWWTIEFKMSSPEHFQLDSLKVTSKWSDISSRQRRFTGIMMNVESGTECLKNFVKAIKDYFQKTVESFPTVNEM